MVKVTTQKKTVEAYLLKLKFIKSVHFFVILKSIFYFNKENGSFYVRDQDVSLTM